MKTALIIITCMVLLHCGTTQAWSADKPTAKELVLEYQLNQYKIQELQQRNEAIIKEATAIRNSEGVKEPKKAKK
jgi:hypothetical protein